MESGFEIPALYFRRCISTAKSGIVAMAEKLCTELIEKEGFELVEVKFEKEYGNDTLCFYIYAPDGVSINDCEKVHNLIEPILDEHDISNQRPYYLSV